MTGTVLGSGNIKMKYTENSLSRRSQPREEDRQALIILMDDTIGIIFEKLNILCRNSSHQERSY